MTQSFDVRMINPMSENYKAGYESRQGEIDELKKRNADLTSTNESLVAYKNQLLDEIGGQNHD